MALIGIKDIGSYIPGDSVSNLDRAEKVGKGEIFIRDKVGFIAVSRKAEDEETSDMCVKAFEALLEKSDLNPEEVDCIVVCTQNPDAYGLPHTSALVQHKLGLPTTLAAFDISLGCSGFVYSFDVISSFMEAKGLKNGLLFTADPYSKVIDPEDYDTELLFGDGACVTWVGENPKLVARKTLFGTNGKLSHSICVKPEDRTLQMLGNNVFKFAMTEVPKQVEACLEANEVSRDDIDLFLFHQGSKYIVDNLTSRLQLPAEKVPFQAAEMGNTVSSTIPFMLEPLLDSEVKRILVSGFGVGLSWATSVLERV